MPYSFQPSYHKFKQMCKLNELPNNEEKYNKILSYFDTSLDTLGWEGLNKNVERIPEYSEDYKKGAIKYLAYTEWKQLNSRIGGRVYFYSDKSEISRYNTNVVLLHMNFYTRRYVLEGNEGSGIYWSEIEVDCQDLGIVRNMTPKGAI